MNTLSLSSRAIRLTAIAITLALCGCKSEINLHTGLTDSDANEVVAALRVDGIPASKHTAKTGVTVSVPESDLSRATAVLSAQGLPHRPAMRMGDVFKKEGLISSPLEERARYIYALSQELESTLAQIDGVVVARVHVVLPEKLAPGEPMQPSSAAVFIKHLPSLEPDVISHRVKQLVARSVPGLGAQAVDRVSAVFVLADAVPQRRPAQPDHTPAIAALLGLLGLSAVAGLATLLVRKTGWRPWEKPAAGALATPAAPQTVPVGSARPHAPPAVATS
jgi:type III secretion protein J